MARTTAPDLTGLLNSRFGGELHCGSHEPPNGHCKACILELCSLAMGCEWTDSPLTLGLPDFRAINDIVGIDPRHRGRRMVELATAYWGWSSWPVARRWVVRERIALLTVQRIIPLLPDLPAKILTHCQDAQNLAAAYAAADAAAAYAAGDAYAAGAARAAAYAARAAGGAARAAGGGAYAARAAAYAAYAADSRLKVFDEACDLWLEAVAVGAERCQ